MTTYEVVKEKFQVFCPKKFIKIFIFVVQLNLKKKKEKKLKLNHRSAYHVVK